MKFLDRETSTALYSNRSQCYLNLKNFERAVQDATSALQIDNTHAKSYFWRAKASYYLKRFKHAWDDLKLVLDQEPNNKQALSYYQQTTDQINKIKLETYEKMLWYADIVEPGHEIPIEEINAPLSKEEEPLK